MKFSRTAAASLMLSLIAAGTYAQQGPTTAPALKVGDDAPPLAVSKWLKGEPVTKIEKGKIYVVEFWATWCGPCREAIPHLTEMAKANPDVTFIGQDVWEEDETAIEPFVKQMGDKMDYHIAADAPTGQDGVMGKTWMLAAGQNTIPMSFLIDKDSKIIWMGHPMELEPILEKVKKGTYDAKAEAALAAKVKDLIDKISAAGKEKNVEAVIAADKELGALKPDLADQIALVEFKMLSHSDRLDEARVRAKSLAENGKDPAILNAVAWLLTKVDSATADDLKLAHKAIDRANDLTDNKEPIPIDTSARVYACEKNWDKAVELETKALGVASGDDKDMMQTALDAYKKKELPPSND